MARVDFTCVSTHTIKLDASGVISASPAFPAHSRLYIIRNESTNREVYIGTAANVKDRFKDRLTDLRHLGFNQNQLNPITIGVVQIKVNNNNRTPGDNGVANGIDVEHLLIRHFITDREKSVRNVAKTQNFQNKTNSRLDYYLTGFWFDDYHGFLNNNYLL